MITFPTTPEAFIAYQEQLIGRELTRNERGAVAPWVKGINLSYEDGLEQDRAALEDSLTKMDELIARRENSPAVQDILQVFRRWIIIAWNQGFHDATHPPQNGESRNEDHHCIH